MSLYEALSLVVSSVGTLGTVWIGLRQLRQSEARQRGPVAPHGPAAQHGPAYHPAPVGPGRAPVPYPPSPYGHPGGYGPAQPAGRRRPRPVTAASLVLFLAAATHPFVVVLYYAIRFATTPEEAAAELGGEGVLDVLVFGGVAFGSALLGVFVSRGSRVALWFVRVLGALSVVLLCLLGGLAALTTLAPEEARFSGFDLLFLGYLAFVLTAYAVGAGLLVTAGARAFFRRV